MVFLDENSSAGWLLGRLRPGGGKETSRGCQSTSVEDTERAFDIADCLERGLARELVSDFVQPLLDARRLWKFQVERSKDRRHYRLFCHRGEFLMFARVSKNRHVVEFFLYDPSSQEDLDDQGRPAFTMKRHGSKLEWSLVQERVEYDYTPITSCSLRSKPEVLSVWHARQAVGSGVNHCMDICLREGLSDEVRRLVTKMPTWNSKVESMVLDFKGRQVHASAKNFQLVEEDRFENVVLQQGKLGQDLFSLDFKYPLTVVQAFGISMTTIDWQ